MPYIPKNFRHIQAAASGLYTLLENERLARHTRAIYNRGHLAMLIDREWVAAGAAPGAKGISRQDVGQAVAAVGLEWQKGRWLSGADLYAVQDALRDLMLTETAVANSPPPDADRPRPTRRVVVPPGGLPSD